MVSKAKRMIFVSALAISIIGAGIYGTRNVFAHDSTVQSTLVQSIAQKFNLKTEEVQAVFDQEKSKREQEMEAKYQQMLTDAVTNGELTEEKKQLILKKHQEIVTSRESEKATFDSLSEAEKRTAMKTKKTELQTWAKDNEVDLKYLAGGRGRFGRHMRGENK